MGPPDAYARAPFSAAIRSCFDSCPWLIACMIFGPYMDADRSRITHSPFEPQSGTSSDVPVPGPTIGPPAALYAAFATPRDAPASTADWIST